MATTVAVFDADGVVIVGPQFSGELSRVYGIPHAVLQPFFLGVFQECLVGGQNIRDVLTPEVLASWWWKGSQKELLDFWFATSLPNTELLEHIQELRAQGIACYMATNNEVNRIEYFQKVLGFASLFDGIFSSASLGYKKPNHEFYQAMLQKLGIQNPNDVVFFDDDIKNVLAAQEVGIMAHLWTHNLTLTEFKEYCFNIK